MDKGVNAGLNVALVGGMIFGADSIDDVGMLRRGAMCRSFNKI